MSVTKKYLDVLQAKLDELTLSLSEKELEIEGKKQVIEKDVDFIFYPSLTYSKKEDLKATNHFNCPVCGADHLCRRIGFSNRRTADISKNDYH